MVTFRVAPVLNGYTPAQSAQFFARLEQALAATPGVTAVTSSMVPALANSNWGTGVAVQGFATGPDVDNGALYNEVGPGYFRTIGITLLAGRDFAESDGPTAPRVAIVNEAFAKFYLPNQNPIGRRLGRGQSGALDTTIIGVVKDAKYGDMRSAPPRVFYRPYEQENTGSLYFYVRTAIEPGQIGDDIRRTVASLDPNLPIRSMRTMEAQIENQTGQERLFAILTGTFAGLALLLAAVGLYGVLAFNVARRTREIGIRMALGARSGQVRGLVVREMALIVAIGVAIGVGAAAASGRAIETALYEMQPWDPAIYVTATLGMLTIALTAAYLPARRASRVDPMIALRQE